MELRERVARAICSISVEEYRVEQLWRDHLADADAAIASVLDAMGEPNNTALQAGADQLFGAVHDDWKVDAGLIWQAMLAAFRTEALGEG